MSGWEGLGIRPADLLLPKTEHLNRYWPVVALDQYTSQPEVWLEAEKQIGNRPSTLRLVVPEAFLKESEARGQAVFKAMDDYLGRDLFDRLENSFVLVERETQSGKRVGLVLAIDLEEYDFREGSRSLIRATEETVLDRIPPRLKVREQSALELSHVMLLVDDPMDSLLGPLYQSRDSLPLVYDLPLLMDGGHIRGWRVQDDKAFGQFMEALRALKAKTGPGDLLFVVGDGNHSLAAAKASWEKQKPGLTKAQQENHPARFAAVELVNLHSPALLFEPIHRLVFGQDEAAVLEALKTLEPEVSGQNPDVVLISKNGDKALKLKGTQGKPVTEAVQQALDSAGFMLDYVHGEEALRHLAEEHGGCGILMPDFPKERLFPTVQQNGRLPRKTFSMGEANEKRFYLEARRIRT